MFRDPDVDLHMTALEWGYEWTDKALDIQCTWVYICLFIQCIVHKQSQESGTIQQKPMLV